MAATTSAKILTAQSINAFLQSVVAEGHAGLFMAKAVMILTAAMQCALLILTVVNLDGMQHVLY